MRARTLGTLAVESANLSPRLARLHCTSDLRLRKRRRWRKTPNRVEKAREPPTGAFVAQNIPGERPWHPALRRQGTRASSCWRPGPRCRGSEAEAALRPGARARAGAGRGAGDTRAGASANPGHTRAPSFLSQARQEGSARKPGPQDRSPAGVRRPRCTTPGPNPDEAALTTAPLLSSAQPGSPYLRDNAKAGRLRRATLTHRAAMTAARAVVHVPDMRGSHWPAPSRAREFAQTLCPLPPPNYFLTASPRSLLL